VSAQHQRAKLISGRGSLCLCAGLLAGLSLAVSGCDREGARSDRGGLLAPDAQGAALEVPSFTLADLPHELNLTPDQRARMGAALRTLGDERQGRLQAWRTRRHGQGGEGDQASPLPETGEPPIIGFLQSASQILTPDQFVIFARFLADRRDAMRLQDGGHRGAFADGFLAGAARRLGLSRAQQKQLRSAAVEHFQKERALWAAWDQGSIEVDAARQQADSLAAAFRTDVQGILTPDQWTKVQDFRQAGLQRRLDQRLAHLGQNLDQQTAFLQRVLVLSADQTTQVQQILSTSVGPRRELLTRVRDGSVPPEEMAIDLKQIEKDTTAQIRALLTPEQIQRFDVLVRLLPPGPRAR
jgi:hypothetical protein